MKIFRFLMVMMATVLLAGFSSCKDDADDIIDNGNENTQSEVYLNVNIAIPNDNSSMKSAEGDTNPKEAATADEYRVEVVNLYFFNDGSGLYAGTVSLVKTTDLNAATPSGDATVYSSKTKRTTLARSTTYKVFAIVNGDASTPLGAATTADDFMKDDKLDNTAFLTTVPTGSTGGLVMASRTGGTSPYVTLTIPGSNSENNPATLVMDVERTVGKLVVTSDRVGNKYDLEVNSSKIADVELVNYAVVNTMKQGFTFRHTGDATSVASYKYGKIDASSEYLMDPQTHLKTLPYVSASAPGWYNDHVSVPTAFTYAAMPAYDSDPATASKIIGYCNENAMEKDSQINGYSTGLIFEAKVTPVGGTVIDEDSNPVAAPANFYYYDGKFYKDIAAVNKVFVGGSVPSSATAKELKDNYGVLYLVGGICYYNYWIRHENNGTSDMGIMEFSIVRNNVYKMKVTGIGAIGSSIPDIDPEDENEISDAFIKMEMTILPWIVRDNSNITLQ